MNILKVGFNRNTSFTHSCFTNVLSICFFGTVLSISICPDLAVNKLPLTVVKVKLTKYVFFAFRKQSWKKHLEVPN